MCFKPNLPANLLLFFDICKRKGDFLLLFYYWVIIVFRTNIQIRT